MYQALKTLELEQLLRLRLALDKPELYHDIEQDIHDLYAYPERLSFTYPDEWRIFIRQQLMKRGIDDGELNTWLADETASPEQTLADLIASSEERFLEAKAIVDEVLHIQAAPDITPITPALKRDLDKLLDN